jgi:hypothetical protein
MHKSIFKSGIFGAVLALIILSGCLLVSGTFVVTEKFTVNPRTGFYFFQADVTQTSTWEDHADDIHFIDAVGFIMYIRSFESSEVDFDVYVDDYSGPMANPTSIPSSATIVIDDLPVSPGESVISYKQSLESIENLDTLKKLAKAGRFDCYTTSTGEDGGTFIVDSVIVMITLSGGQ